MNRKKVAETAGAGALGAWLAFGVLAGVVATHHHGAPLPLDQGLLTWSVGHRPPMAVAVARGLTVTGTGVVPYVLAVVAGLIAGRGARQRLVAVLLAVGCLSMGQSLRYAVMNLVARARPPQYEWQTHASGWSFPSGHTTTAALTAGLLITALYLRSPHGRTAVRLAVACWGAAVGLTRVFLGVHWFTDVVGGWLFALGWLGVLLWAAARLLPPRFVPGDQEPAPDPSEGPGGAPPGGRGPRDSRHEGRSRPA
ncbi:phosphatase PAP2 family protein [Streptomyces sp. NPDC015139]|uniref:phosphatase PAP2 family protein n=1 Tax=Streptomyces sp. NPDC015139 TaxID=3364942 RepID=UPI003701F398